MSARGFAPSGLFYRLAHRGWRTTNTADKKINKIINIIHCIACSLGGLSIPYLSPPSGSCPLRFAPPRPRPALRFAEPWRRFASGAGWRLVNALRSPSINSLPFKQVTTICAPVPLQTVAPSPLISLRSYNPCPWRWSVAMIQRVIRRTLLRRARLMTRWGSLAFSQVFRSLRSLHTCENAPPPRALGLSLRSSLARTAPLTGAPPPPNPRASLRSGLSLPVFRFALVRVLAVTVCGMTHDVLSRLVCL